MASYMIRPTTGKGTPRFLKSIGYHICGDSDGRSFTAQSPPLCENRGIGQSDNKWSSLPGLCHNGYNEFTEPPNGEFFLEAGRSLTRVS